MKKTIVLLLVFCFLASSLAFGQVNSNLGAFDMILADDFASGPNYMNRFYPEELMNGYRISNGDSFTLRIRFTASRDLENELLIGLFGFSPPTYWVQLSWDDARGNPLQKVENIKAGQEYSATIQLRAIRNAAGAAPEHNGIIFLTTGEGRRRANGGVKGPVTISFKEFVLTKN